IEGIRDSGSVDKQLHFTRVMTDGDASGEAEMANVLPPFARVRRTLLLGLDWRVETSVQRVSPLDAAVVLDIPLLPGESVLTEGIDVRQGTARVTLDASARELIWESVLEPVETIVLRHPDTVQWTETWEADVSPILHMEWDGIPVVLREQNARWFPMWRPWPGEVLTVQITRPAGVEGQTLTVQRSSLEVNPGKRVTDCTLSMTMQSSQGMQHAIRIPDGAEVQEVVINDKVQPIRQEGRRLPLTITPGIQTITVKWRENRGVTMMFRTPEVDLGIRSVNNTIKVPFPVNRWILWVWGPRLGPAVLFWTFLVVIVLAAWLLSRTGWTPLRFRHWFLLGLGLSQGGLAITVIVVGWLLLMHARAKLNLNVTPFRYNAAQIIGVMVTGMALIALIVAIGSGLLGRPDMSIAGNGSTQSYLEWYQDCLNRTLPEAMIVSVSLFFYRVAMLLWALWLAFYMISLVKWIWNQFSHPVFWRSFKENQAVTGNVKESR
ncbi:hypothetical protein JXA80_06255, partial [bacterium]|nr:hypothetical protein [candidate division CSSED10-310 bacterium]